MLKRIVLATAAVAALSASPVKAEETTTILNASYDISRELFAAITPKFVEHCKATAGKDAKVDLSFAGTSRQPQDIIQGKKVDTVTYNQVTDIEILARRGVVKSDWQQA